MSPTSHFSDAMWEVWCEHSQSSLPISRFQYSAPFLTSHFTFPISHIFQSPLSTAFEVIPPINNTNFGSSTDKGTFEILFFYNLSLKSGKTSRKFSHEVGNEKWGMRNGKWEMGSGKISKPDILEWEVGLPFLKYPTQWPAKKQKASCQVHSAHNLEEGGMLNSCIVRSVGIDLG